jgi:hypothetical protein
MPTAAQRTLPGQIEPVESRMTLFRSQALAPRSRGLLMVAIGLVPALAACAGSGALVQLPARPAAKPAAVIVPMVLTPSQQIVAAITGYTAALGQADKSRSTSAARQLLKPYLAASRLGGLVQAMSAIWSSGESFYGADVMHVSSVTIDGGHAFVHDCDDTSGMGLTQDATGQIVPGSSGVPRANLVTRLDLVRGRWIVDFQLLEDVPCTP